MKTIVDVGVTAGDLGALVREIELKVEELGLEENFILVVNTSAPYQGLRPCRVKPIGNQALEKMTDVMCECGCRLKTDGNVWWCSNIKCDFVGKEETF
jgi:hypothetical protein